VNAPGRIERLVLVAVACVSACASQPSEDYGASTELQAERAPMAEPDAEQAASPPADQPERSLAEIERELARNEARLRELGVELPARAATATAIGEAGEPEPTPKPETKREATGAGGGLAQPGAAPRPQSEPSERDDGRSASRKGKGDKPAKNAKDSDDRFAPAPPQADAAKAAPPSGNPAELDAAARCRQLCDLGQITCELSVQICELADRHDGEDDYRAACERSAEDCSAAQEACDACEA
jgi:hypothetical protein